MKFNNRQLSKISDQLRLGAWVQDAVFYIHLHLFSYNVTMQLISSLWIMFQIIALYIDGKLKDSKHAEEGATNDI